MKLAYVDGLHYISQPQSMRVSVEELLHEDYAASRRALIGERALDPSPGQPRPGGTVPGPWRRGGQPGLVHPEQLPRLRLRRGGASAPASPCRTAAPEFSLDPDHVNCLEPGKQTFHTIIPGFLSKGRRPLGPFSVMGVYSSRRATADGDEPGGLRLNPQAALDAPRWQWLGGARVGIEHAAPARGGELAQRGHQVEIAYDSTSYGRGQIVLRPGQRRALWRHRAAHRIRRSRCGEGPMWVRWGDLSGG
ncbi:gamma-glutamyltransferase [Pseudomonas aeruginosa]